VPCDIALLLIRFLQEILAKGSHAGSVLFRFRHIEAIRHFDGQSNYPEDSSRQMA
jgi:hypothetical protein